MKLLITGASGFIGRHTVLEALCRGHKVVALVRADPPREWSGQAGLEVRKWDLSLEQPQTLFGMGIDGVIHLAAALTGDPEAQHRVTVRGTENLIHEIQQAGISRLVGVSSISVLDYISLPAMALVDESIPVSPDVSGMGLYASLKLKQEALFKAFAAESGNHCVILRPGLVYDDQRLIAGHAGVIKGPVRLLAGHAGEVPVVEVQGVARAILAAATGSVPNGEIIHLVDDELPDQRAYLAALRQRHLLPGGGMSVSWKLLTNLARSAYAFSHLIGKPGRLPEALLPQACAARLKPFRYSNAKAKRLLGWQPRRQFA